MADKDNFLNETEVDISDITHANPKIVFKMILNNTKLKNYFDRWKSYTFIH